MLHVSGLEPHYDAIIVGARCAGAATAMLLARAGLRVLAIDRQAYGSDTLSTHALMRPAVMQLSRWNLLEQLMRSGTPLIGSTTFHYGPREFIMDIRPEPGLPGLIAPRRNLLDRVLVDAARDAGAAILHETSVLELTSDQSGRVTGIVLENAARRTLSFRAEHVIGADGIGSLVARSVRAPVLASGNASVAHIFGYAPQPLQLSGYHWYFGEQVSGGVIPTNDGLACFVVSVPTARFDTEFRSDLAANWGRALNVLSAGLGDLATSTLIDRLKAFRGVVGRLREAYGPGWILAGDAGFFRDPLTSHGISDALRDAEGVATAILSGQKAAFREFQDERDSIAMPILETTNAISKFDWSLDELPDHHKRFSDAMKLEVRLLAARASHSEELRACEHSPPFSKCATQLVQGATQ